MFCTLFICFAFDDFLVIDLSIVSHSVDVCHVATKYIRNMHAVLTNQITYIVGHYNNSKGHKNNSKRLFFFLYSSYSSLSLASFQSAKTKFLLIETELDTRQVE